MLSLVYPEDHDKVQEAVRALAQQNEGLALISRFQCKDHSWRWLEWNACSNGDQIYAVARDTTEQRLIEEQLRQAQKMEAIGRLAGGVAHDFNNLLNVIIGYSELALFLSQDGTTLSSYLMEIKEAANRSADLTRQLLAFSRKQLVVPRVIQLNEVIAAQHKMLTRLIGEEIAIDFRSQADLWPVQMDPIQIHQILANLAVNARDAISGVGTIVIQTENITLRTTVREGHLEVPEGEYVRLSFEDNGHGIALENIGLIFEPFYTTKEAGKGTGLGLSTVYGIVKQNKGGIQVITRPGGGTSFHIYLHRHVGESEQTEKIADAKKGTGTETILIVEDEPQLLDLSRSILENHGYQVLCAQNADEACRLVDRYGDHIHLLLTDVVMPEMNGKALQDRIIKSQPTIRTLFMSWYESSYIAERGLISQNINFISKPFSLNDLVAKVRHVLDA